MSDWIKDFIPHGKENAITRVKLKHLTGHDDRGVRTLIEKARSNSEPKPPFILSSSKAKGYWKSVSVNEIRAFVKEIESKINKLYKIISPMKKWLEMVDNGETKRHIKGYKQYREGKREWHDL